MLLRSVIPPGRRTVRTARPTRPRAAADRARISLSALTPGLRTGLPQRRGPARPQPPAAGRHPPGGIGKARGGERREGIPQVGSTSAAESMVARYGAKPHLAPSRDQRAATRAHRRDHPPRDACDRPPADQQPAHPIREGRPAMEETEELGELVERVAALDIGRATVMACIRLAGVILLATPGTG